MMSRSDAPRTVPWARGVASLVLNVPRSRVPKTEASILRDYVRDLVKVAQDNLRRAAGPNSFEEEHRIIPLKDALAAVEVALHPEDRA